VDSSDILPFIKATRNTFETMFQMEVECGAPALRKQETPTFDVSAIIGMSGDVEGSVVLSFPMETARRVVAVFTGMEAPTEQADLADAVGELVNIIAGGAKAQFSGKNVSISCPSVVIGQSHSVFGAKDVVCVTIPCTCDCGQFNVEVATKMNSKAMLPSLSGASAS
jgi:chemotaxis protein CheX